MQRRAQDQRAQPSSNGPGATRAGGTDELPGAGEPAGVSAEYTSYPAQLACEGGSSCVEEGVGRGHCSPPGARDRDQNPGERRDHAEPGAGAPPSGGAPEACPLFQSGGFLPRLCWHPAPRAQRIPGQWPGSAVQGGAPQTLSRSGPPPPRNPGGWGGVTRKEAGAGCELYKATARAAAPSEQERSAPRIPEARGCFESPCSSTPHAQSSPQRLQPPGAEGGAMWSALSRHTLLGALALTGLWLAAAGRPLTFSDAGPHVHYGWGQPVRLRHLYTASPHGLFSCFLRIRADGTVDGARGQSAHSLLEIKAVALRTVALKGVQSARYLCMSADGQLQGLPQYSAEDCAFEEEIRPDGYNVYLSKKHGLPVSLSSARQRQLYRGRGFLPLSHFLPMLPEEPVEPEDDLESVFSLPLETDSMDPFGIASPLGLVKSPSFQE
ncbi:PREDICTED: POU domain, class 3, transcription factor 3-like [Chrysochloris asiatica]|uniref:Fibroblast growth factor n=1 Tax=Chrysochloris asiatica TaxID=185453 RepID=A0A9B0WML3_CHRAS|nr:PREDICTED: POU domain, class 3, transcription factor 3-like [Chrysochloris asiatica]